MATTKITGLILIGAGTTSAFDTVYNVTDEAGSGSSSFTIPATAKATATLHISVVNKGGWLVNTYGGTARSIIRFCNSNRSKTVDLWSKGLTSGQVDQSSDFTTTIDISALRGERLYGCVARHTPSSGAGGVQIQNRLWFELTYEYGNPVTKGNKILNSDIAQTGVSPGVGTVISNSNFSKGTIITASDFNRVILGL